MDGKPVKREAPVGNTGIRYEARIFLVGSSLFRSFYYDWLLRNPTFKRWRANQVCRKAPAGHRCGRSHAGISH